MDVEERQPVPVFEPVTRLHRLASFSLRAAPVVVPAVIVFLVYFPAIKLGMVWDDNITFHTVPYYSDPAFLFAAIRNPLIFLPNYYRPLAVVSFLAQNYSFGVDPKVLHLTSIVIHGLNASLVSLIALRIAPTMAPQRNATVLAAVAGLLYGLHPTLIESATFISSRYDLLLTFFLLVAFLADASLHRPLWRATAVGSAFLLAASCKETALAFPLALPLWHLAREPGPLLPVRDYVHSLRERGHLHVYVAVILGGLVYLTVRYLALGYVLQSVGVPAQIKALGTIGHIQLVAYSVLQYLKLVFLPFGNITPVHPLPTPLVSTVPNWITLALFSLLVALTIFFIYRRVPGAWLFAAALLSLFPISGVLLLPRPPGAYFAERDLAFPMTLFVFASVFLLADGYQYLVGAASRGGRVVQRAAIAILAIWFAASLVTIRHTIPLWSSDLTLWSWAAREQPQSGLAVGNLAMEYIKKGQWAHAYVEATHLQHIPGATPQTESTAWFIFAVLAFNARHRATAIRLITKATETAPRLSGIPTTRAHYLNADGQYQKAAEQALSVLQHTPYQPTAHAELGVALLGLGHYAQAVKELRFSVANESDPDRKAFAQKNLEIADRARKEESRGRKVRVKPEM